MKTLTDYTPKRIEIIIPKQYEKVPQTIFDGAKTLEEVQKVLHKEFVTTNETLKVLRKLDNYEVKTIRENYSLLLEQKLPIVKEELERIVEETKRALTDAKDKVVACEANINDLVKQVRDGNKEITLEQNQCYRIPVSGHYLYFAWINDTFALVRVERIPEWDAGKIFSQGEQNMEAFNRIFGIDIIAVLDERKAVQMASDGEQ